MSDTPLMPKATAVWLIDNTSLSFDQIAAFCGLHPLEVKGIADGDVAGGVRGIDPVTANQLTREEIQKGEADTTYRLRLSRPKTLVPNKGKKAPRYTPVSKRQNRPDAIAWMVRNHPEVSDAQIGKLLGTTKATIQSVRDRSHWNSANLTPQDPVGLGLCSQIDLDMVVKKAASKKARMDEANGIQPDGDTLKPADETVQYEPEEDRREKRIDATQVFANFTGSSSDDDEDDDN
ncbi:DUF1013 domain-containing protein [Aquisalinus flavus]|uniref:DUF1013 domain-containing protein n=1 Tax=Aquisalinus flavus TaxID=1526572 RepID=A0A8J2V3L4_9PROT|nr:cell cycle transcriptional regulator TrcR [Aquisalinus flavus]MBD0426985.1 DUF1013 domain-containing protein [Aquisalinus flavus]UNE46818.1 DUF1013 domain-containing protein [Aquisalinus flavus]GGC97451.1 hypothetical protein GCM10011342_02970 [Aquisalinus flavus]